VQSPLLSLDQLSYRDDHLYVDLRQQLVILDGKILHLTSMEYLLLALLVEHAGEAVPRTVLLTLTRKVDMHIHGLRRNYGYTQTGTSKRSSVSDTVSSRYQGLRAMRRGAQGSLPPATKGQTIIEF